MARPAPSTSWILAVHLLGAGCAAVLAERHEFERRAMGTTFRIVVYAEDGEEARRAAAAAFARIAELDAALSDYDPESELSRLSRASDVVAPTDWLPVSTDLLHVLARAQELAAESGGAFDVTVGPYVRLWRRARRQGELPAPERLEEARTAVGHRLLELDAERRRARLLASGMRLDLGGIAKGFALDEAMRILDAHGLERALVDGGGDVRVGNAPPERCGWCVEVPGTEESTNVLLLSSCAVATSGDLERYVEVDGVRYSHLIDPATGRALTRRLLVTVVAPRGEDADGWASALSVLGPERGFPLLPEGDGIVARVVERAGAEAGVWETPGFPAALSCGSPPFPDPRTGTEP